MEEYIDFSLRLWYNYYSKGGEIMLNFPSIVSNILLTRHIVRSESKKEAKEIKECYLNLKEEKSFPDKIDFQTIEEDYYPRKGCRIDPNGAMWEEPNIMYI
jgi:hypothetical protein